MALPPFTATAAGNGIIVSAEVAGAIDMMTPTLSWAAAATAPLAIVPRR
jgi:hypothetical protein